MAKLRKELILALPKWAREQLLPVLLTIGAAGFLFASLGLWLFATLAYGILAKESFIFDQQILLALRELHRPLLDVVMLGLTSIGQPIVLLSISTGLGIWLLRLGARSQATVLIIAVAGATALSIVLKNLFGRSRPILREQVVDVGQYSFPAVTQ